MEVTLQDVRKVFKAPDGTTTPVIDVPAFHLPPGEQAAMLGTSGSGKTTLLNLIAGLVAPDAGRILMKSRTGQTTDLAGLTEAERDEFRGRHLGFVFQKHHLLGGFTALENVQLGMTFTGRRPDRAWAEHLLRQVGLSDRLHYRPAKLSLGQQQRVAVARAMANRPALVLADEPTGSLDARTAQQVLHLIRSLCTEVKAALLLVTHDLGIAGQLERVIALSDINRCAPHPETSESPVPAAVSA